MFITLSEYLKIDSTRLPIPFVKPLYSRAQSTEKHQLSRQHVLLMKGLPMYDAARHDMNRTYLTLSHHHRHHRQHNQVSSWRD